MSTETEVQELVINKLTKAQYEASSKSSTELYYVTDEDYYATKTDLNTKQDLLVSGTNIKTINNQSIVGEGNIEVGGKTAESIANQNTESSVKDIKVWQGSETMWNNGEATTWYNYETDVVPIINDYYSYSTQLCRIVYLDGKYLSISNQNKKIFSTTNISEINSWQDTGKVAYSLCSVNNMLLCIDGTKTVCKSTDGVNWTPTTQTVTSTDSTVQFCNDRFFLIGGGSAYYSFDGEVWNQVVDGNILSSRYKIYYANGVWIQSRGNTSYPYSTDGINWSLKEYDPLVRVNVFSSDTKFYLVKGSEDVWFYYDLYESLDALTWSLKREKVFHFDDDIYNMRASYINGIFFISDGDHLKISSDLNTFTDAYFPSAHADVIYDGTKYIASEFYDFWGQYLVIQYDKKNCYLLDAEPTTSSKVYSDKDVQSSLRVTSVSSNSVVLSDGDTYNKNSAGDKFSYRTIGEAHPDYLSFIDNKEVRLGNTTIADNTDTSAFATKTELSQKQDTLVSGTSIKTVNNESILGSGNIEIKSALPTYIKSTETLKFGD